MEETMNSMSSAERSTVRVLAAVAAALLTLGSFAATPEHRQEVADTMRPPDPDTVFAAKPEPPRGSVLLKDLRRVAVIPPGARESMIGERTYRPAVGSMMPPWAVEGSKAWADSPLVRVDAAKITTMFISSELPGAIQAGYIPPRDPDEARTPWLIFILSGMPGDWATGQFVVESTSEAGGFALREVVAIDLEQVYFKAVPIDADTGLAGPDEFFMVADYSLVAP